MDSGLGMVKLAEFREMVSASVVPLDISAIQEDTFMGSVKAHDVGRINFFLIQAAPHAVHRTEELIAASHSQKIKVTLLLHGQAVLKQDGRTAFFNQGDIAIYDTSRPYQLFFPVPSKILVLMVPREDWSMPIAVLDDLTAITLTKERALSSVVTAFFQELAKNFDALNTRTGSQLAEMSVAILRPIILAAAEDVGYSLDGKAQLVRSAKKFIDAHLDDPHLNPSAIAKAHFISLRQLYSAFSESDLSVAATIKQRRLDRAHVMINDQTCDDLSIGAIAVRCGLPDAAYFSRAFKKRFGVSPRQARNGR